MTTPEPMKIAFSTTDLFLLPKLGNRHGLVAGATGTGKTVTLQRLAEAFSNIGTPVFAADIKGDLSGMSQAGSPKPRIVERLQAVGISDFAYAASPVVFWDVFGEQGHPLRATVSDLGPLLFSRILDLNETQTGVLTLVFKIADDNGMLLLDLKDLRSMVQYVGEHASQFTTAYGNISVASVGAIQRGLLALEQQGADKLFGEPALALDDMLQTDSQGRGVINILAADKLMQSPKLYATFLLWLLSELYETLPEVGDLDQPKMVFFFDEAHLLFNDAPKALEEKIEQVVRLIRSKGIGVYFVTQNPIDIPDAVLGQLGNRVQHALRAFTPRDQKAVKSAAETFRANPDLDVATAITEMGVGEALISFLDDRGTPGIVQRGLVLPPGSQIGAITPEQRNRVIASSVIAGHYEAHVDRASAYELLRERATAAAEEAERQEMAKQLAKEEALRDKALAKEQAQREKEAEQERKRRAKEPLPKGMLETLGDAANSRVGRDIVRGLLGSILGGSTRRR